MRQAVQDRPLSPRRCPECGGSRCPVISTRARERIRRCRFCQTQFAQPVDGGRVRRLRRWGHGAIGAVCPRCGSVKTRCYNSCNRPVRYHACRACGFRFKSVEEPMRVVEG